MSERVAGNQCPFMASRLQYGYVRDAALVSLRLVIYKLTIQTKDDYMNNR